MYTFVRVGLAALVLTLSVTYGLFTTPVSVTMLGSLVLIGVFLNGLGWMIGSLERMAFLSLQPVFILIWGFVAGLALASGVPLLAAVAAGAAGFWLYRFGREAV
jgi:hypothetical protein